MLDCPKCKEQVQSLVIPLGGTLGCRVCSGPERTRYNANLNGVYASDGHTRLTNGKAWEIANRIVSPDDGKTLINRKTGKPAQY